MSPKIPRLATLVPLSLTLLISGEPDKLNQEIDENPQILTSDTCDREKLPSELEAQLSSVRETAKDSVEFVLAAGPNRHRSLETAIDLINDVQSKTQYKISVVLRVDEAEVSSFILNNETTIDSSNPNWIQILSALDSEDNPGQKVGDLLGQLNPQIHQSLEVQTMGTSYTEVSHAIEETDAEHLVFFAHNLPLEWRLELAAEDTISAQTTGPVLQSVHVLCHDGNQLPSNTGKEVISWVADYGSSALIGHDGLMQTSQGGHRLARTQEYVEKAVGLR